MKRFLSIALIVCMLLSTLTFLTLASAETTNYYRVGTNEYATLSAAIQALNKESGTIVVINNAKETSLIREDANVADDQVITITGDDPTTDAVETKKLVFDHSVSAEKDNATFYAMACDLTFDHLTVVLYAGIRPRKAETAQTITFTDCTVESCAVEVVDEETEAVSYSSSQRTYSFCADYTGFELILNNTTLNCYAAERLLSVNDEDKIDTSVNLDINNSTINFPAASPTIQIVEAYTSGDEVTVDLDKDSKIIAQGLSSMTWDRTYMFELHNANSTANLILAAGAKVQIPEIGSLVATHYYSSGDKACNGTLDITDYGATINYHLISQQASFGIKLPNINMVAGNSNVIGWKVGEKLYANGVNIPIEKGVAIEPVPVAYDVTTGLVMAEGASVLVSNPTGIRYTATVKDELKTALTGATATYGAILAPNAYVEAVDAFTKDALAVAEGEPVKYVDTEGSFKWANADENEYRVVLTNILNPEMDFTAIPYVTVTYADGSSATFYGKQGDVRSIKDVADAALTAQAITQEEYNTIMGITV